MNLYENLRCIILVKKCRSSGKINEEDLKRKEKITGISFNETFTRSTLITKLLKEAIDRV
jgi:hypothetical protein